MKEPCVCILASRRDGTHYIGVTSSPIARHHQHRTGAVPGFTSRDGVHRLVWFEACNTMEVAITLEKQLER